MTRIVLPEGTESKTDPPKDLEIVRDVVYGQGGGHDLTMDILRPAGKQLALMPTLIGIHGSGWTAGTRDWCLETLLHFAIRGYFTAAITHRFSGEAPFPSMIHDCNCSVRYLRAHAAQYGIDPDRIGVWGFSSGGHLASLVGTGWHVQELQGNGGWAEQSTRVQAVCDWFGPTAWLPKGLLGMVESSDAKTEDSVANPINHIRPGQTPPFLIMHGDKDELVTLASSEILYDALTKAGIESTFVIAEGAGHHLVRYDIHSIMVDFFGKHLKG
jgi:acetyl esterase/lipase